MTDVWPRLPIPVGVGHNNPDVDFTLVYDAGTDELVLTASRPILGSVTSLVYDGTSDGSLTLADFTVDSSTQITIPTASVTLTAPTTIVQLDIYNPATALVGVWLGSVAIAALSDIIVTYDGDTDTLSFASASGAFDEFDANGGGLTCATFGIEGTHTPDGPFSGGLNPWDATTMTPTLVTLGGARAYFGVGFGETLDITRLEVYSANCAPTTITAEWDGSVLIDNPPYPVFTEISAPGANDTVRLHAAAGGLVLHPTKSAYSFSIYDTLDVLYGPYLIADPEVVDLQDTYVDITDPAISGKTIYIAEVWYQPDGLTGNQHVDGDPPIIP